VAEARHASIPMGQDLRHTIAQHLALSEPKVERMSHL
jgi:hypothetical protein